MKAILNTRNDIIDAVAINQATGLHYATGNASFSYTLITSPCIPCKRFSRTLADARIAIKRAYLLIVKVRLTNPSANCSTNHFWAKTLVKA